MLQQLSIDDFLNQKYYRPVKDFFNRPDRMTKYININMVRHLSITTLPEHKWGVDTKEVRNKLEKDNLSMLVPILDRALDECSVQTYYLFQEYQKGMKHYIPSNPLISVLKEIDVDMKCSYLRPETSGYFEMSHTNIYPPAHWSKNPLANVIFKVEENSLMLTVQFQNNDLAPTSFFIPLHKDENLSDTLKSLSFRTIFKGEKIHLDRKDIEQSDINMLKLIFNLIIYVTNPNEEFKSEFNKFSPNQKIANIEKQTYTSKSFIKLGFDAEFLRLVTTETYDVRGHWRWQPVGIGRLGRRLTFIKPHQRTQSKFLTKESSLSLD